MKKITTALLTVAMLVSATGFVPVSAQDTQAVSFAVMADGIEYTPEKAEAENEYYVELLNSERSESPVLEVVADEGAEVAVTVEDGKIADVALKESSEAVMVFYPLLETAAEEVGREVVANQSLTIAVSRQNAASAQAVLDAVAEGLEQAKK